MDHIAQCLQKFGKLPQDIKDILGGPDALVAVKEIELKYGVNTSLVVVLVGIGELAATKIEEYLRRKEGLSEEDALDVSNELTRTIFSRLVAEITPPPVSSGAELIEEFKNDLLKLISDKDLAESFNREVFLRLKDEPAFLAELEMTITNLSLTVSKSKIADDKGTHQPTIANWIKDFVLLNGSGNFDDLVLANYISNSKNAKSLSAAEKILLSRVFKVYRNIAFFDEITDKSPVKFWSIVPTDIEAESTPSIETNQAEVEGGAVHQDASVGETPVVSAEDSETAKLQAALNDYDPGSLEYKVVKQELERLRSNATARR